MTELLAQPTTLLFSMIGLLGINQVLLRAGLITRSKVLYWIIQVFDLCVIGALAFKGIPGLQGQATFINWILVMVVAMHVVQNYYAVVSARGEQRAAEIEQEWAELEARREQIRKMEADERKAAAEKARAAKPPEGSS